MKRFLIVWLHIARFQFTWTWRAHQFDMYDYEKNKFKPICCTCGFMNEGNYGN
jgi:hypothetical protein